MARKQIQKETLDASFFVAFVHDTCIHSPFKPDSYLANVISQRT